MAYQDAQKEIGHHLRNRVGHCRFVKKSRMRKMRREIKKDIDFVPHFNRYHGYS